jgi:O-antigen ligase
MTESILKYLLPLSLAIFCIYALYGLISSPGSFEGYVYLGALICGEMLAVALWNYRQSFFAILMVVFLWAGTDAPLKNVGLSARWLVLTAGAVVGFVLYMKGTYSFRTIHLLGLFAVISALVSAMVSSYPKIALWKTASLFLLFLYAAAGGRLSIADREAKFMARLLLACEVVVYFSAFQYFVRRDAFFGNPNSLGAVMGIAVTPLLLWGTIVSEGTRGYSRRLFALILSIGLLLSSYSRAGIGAGVFSCGMLCVGTRHYRLLAKGVGVVLAAAFLIAATVPLPDTHNVHTDTLMDVFLYKGKTEEGVFGSRQSPWGQASLVIHEHPWFGSGFGTSVTSREGRQFDFAFASTNGTIREHGNSYLAILEWVGLLGVVPFVMLILLVAFKIGQVILWLRRTGNPLAPAVPIAIVLAAGIVHATFEDWMFAPGYYLCVFFWVLAFMLDDVLPTTEAAPAAAVSTYGVPPFHTSYGIYSPGR